MMSQWFTKMFYHTLVYFQHMRSVRVQFRCGFQMCVATWLTFLIFVVVLNFSLFFTWSLFRKEDWRCLSWMQRFRFGVCVQFCLVFFSTRILCHASWQHCLIRPSTPPNSNSQVLLPFCLHFYFSFSTLLRISDTKKSTLSPSFLLLSFSVHTTHHLFRARIHVSVFSLFVILLQGWFQT